MQMWGRGTRLEDRKHRVLKISKSWLLEPNFSLNTHYFTRYQETHIFTTRKVTKFFTIRRRLGRKSQYPTHFGNFTIASTTGRPKWTPDCTLHKKLKKCGGRGRGATLIPRQLKKPNHGVLSVEIVRKIKFLCTQLPI